MYLIRQFREEDVYEIFVLSAMNLTEMYSLDLFIDIYRAWPSGFLVADMNKILGYIAGQKLENSARILMLAVAQGYRHKGVGSALLNRFILNCRRDGIHSVTLEVRTSNQNAIEFYQKHGFQIISMINNYYTNNDSAYVMWRII